MGPIGEIAKLCGVSISTVSKAFNNYKDISPETRERIWKVAKEKGYESRLPVRAAKTKKTSRIGVLIRDVRNSPESFDSFYKILKGIRNEAQHLSCDISFLPIEAGSDKNRVARLKRDHNIDGIIIAEPNLTHDKVRDFAMTPIPAVSVNCVYENCTAIMADQSAGISELMDHILRCGHQRIAFISGSRSLMAQMRLSGFRQKLKEQAIYVPDEYIVSLETVTAESINDATKQFMEMPIRPTCVLYPDDMSAIYAMMWLRENGWRVPEDISVAGFGGMTLAEIIKPHLTTLENDQEAMGREAVREVMRLIDSPRDEEIKRIIVPHRVIEGMSTAVVTPQTQNS